MNNYDSPPLNNNKEHGLPCIYCGSSNGVTWYGDHVYCYVCQKRSVDDEFIDVYQYMDEADGTWQEKRKERGDEVVSVTAIEDKERYKRPIVDFIRTCDREYTEIASRGLTKATCQKYKAKSLIKSTEDGKRALVGFTFPVPKADGSGLSTKIKINQNSSYIPDDVKEPYFIENSVVWRDSGLFGQDLFAKGGKFVTITEGEIDAMSVYQMLKQTTGEFDPPVVSIKDGAGSVRKFFQTPEGKRAYDWLMSFDKIRICMDNDQEGKKAQNQLFSIFPKTKLSVVKIPAEYKDAGKMLELGKTREFISLWKNAEEFRPNNIIFGGNSRALLEEDDSNPITSYDTVFEGLNDKTFGGRMGEVWVWTAQAKIGKNTILREVTYGLIEKYDNIKLGTVYLEGKAANHIKDYVGMVSNKPFRRPDCKYTPEEYERAKAAFPWDKIGFFDTREEYNYEDVIDAMNYYVDVMGCNVIIFDNAMVLSEQSSDKEREILNKFMSFVCRLADAKNVWVNVVAHLNREDNIQGTSNIEKKADMVIRLTRDTMSEDEVERNTTRVYVTHNRYTGDTGFACKLRYIPATSRLEEYWDDPLPDSDGQEPGEDDTPVADRGAAAASHSALRKDKVAEETQKLMETRNERRPQRPEGHASSREF